MVIVAGDKIADWLSRLVKIPSVSPPQAGPRAGIPGEARLSQAVANWCKKLGAKVTTHEVLPGRPATYAIWKGRSTRWIAIDVHLDTVGVESMEGDPFSGRIVDRRVYGRGAVDTKASLAVALAMLEKLKPGSKRLPCNLLLAATVDEEVSATGAPALARWLNQRKLRIDEMLVAEPTNCAPVYGHKGVARMRFIVRGKSAHSSNPARGKNAIVSAARIVDALYREGEKLKRKTSQVGVPALTVTLVNGGEGINIVPARCTVTVDRRVVPGESAQAVCRKLEELARSVSTLPVKMEIHSAIDAFYNDSASPFVRSLLRWSRKPAVTMPYCTNAWAYSRVARQCVVLGPGSIEQAHAAVEWVEIAQLEKLADIYARWWGVA